MTQPSDQMSELLADGVDKCSGLMEDLRKDIENLVDQYMERIKDMAFLTIGMNNVETKHANASDYSPEVLRSRIVGYVNVLAAITKPINHDCGFYETMIHDALKALEGTKHFERALQSYKRNLERK